MVEPDHPRSGSFDEETPVSPIGHRDLGSPAVDDPGRSPPTEGSSMQDYTRRLIVAAALLGVLCVSAGSARAGVVISFSHHTNSSFNGTFRTGQLTFDWDATNNQFLSGTVLRSSGDFMSGPYTLDTTTQAWSAGTFFGAEKQVFLNASPASGGSLSSLLTSMSPSSFTVGQTLNYEVNIVHVPFGVNEVWQTPGVVEVTGISGTPLAAVPEPSTFVLGLVGVAVSGGVWWRRRRSAA
jgi:hypothetical protein